MQELTKLKNYLIFSISFFAFSSATGFVFAYSNPELALRMMDQIMEQFQTLIHPNPFVQFCIIFFHNSLAAFLSLAFFFMFGIASVFSIFSNGMIIGLVVNVYSNSIGVGNVLLLLLPHGIVELPAFFLATSLGIWLGFSFAKSLSPQHNFKDPFFWAMKIFLKFILPLLFVAAVIETFITPLLYSFIIR